MRKTVITPAVTALLVSAVVLVWNSCRKSAAAVKDPELVGEWNYRERPGGEHTIDLTINERGPSSHVNVKKGAVITSSGRAKIKNDVLIIGVFRRQIDQYPTVEELAPGKTNMFMILEGDSFYKKPRIKVEPCFNGRQDNAEEGVDCGGLCAPCPSCRDQVMNQHETAVDCGGECKPCYVPPCIDQLTDNTAITQVCASWTATSIQPTHTYTDNDCGYSYDGRFCGTFYSPTSTLTIYFPVHPAFDLTYEVVNGPVPTSETAYDSAEVWVRFKHENKTYEGKLTKGKLTARISNNFVTLVICNETVELLYLGCVTLTARLRYEQIE